MVYQYRSRFYHGTIGSTNATIGNTIGANGNANGTIGPPSGTIGTNGKPMVPLATNGTIGKISNGTIGRTMNARRVRFKVTFIAKSGPGFWVTARLLFIYFQFFSESCDTYCNQKYCQQTYLKNNDYHKMPTSGGKKQSQRTKGNVKVILPKHVPENMFRSYGNR